MKVAAAALSVSLMSIAFAQNPLSCSQAISDPNFEIPASLAFGNPTAVQARSRVLLFSQDGLDFYGAERSKYLTGAPMDENGAWIVGVFRDEVVRRAEASRLMLRLGNPSLDGDYDSALKYIVAFVELAIDRDSQSFKAWMKCSKITSSQDKCPIPHEVPMVSEVSYYQPNQCRRPSDFGPLYSDPKPRVAYPRATYTSPALSLFLQKDLVSAAGIMLDRFRNEDAVKIKK
jgi:hypothetical protein